MSMLKADRKQATSRQYRCSKCGELTGMPKEMGCPGCHAEPGDLYDADIKIGDRVLVRHRGADRNRAVKVRYGIIIGENRKKTCWRLQIDGLTTPINYNKTFVFLEPTPAQDAA